MHHYLRPIPLDLSLHPYHIHTYHSKILTPPFFGSLVIMAHTHRQDLEAHFTTLQSNFIETQQEVRQLSANVLTINRTMQSSMEEIKKT